jgi:hypothetical protein
MPFYLHVGTPDQSFKTLTITLRDQNTGLPNEITLGGDIDWARDAGQNIKLNIVNKVTLEGAPAGSYVFAEAKAK